MRFFVGSPTFLNYLILVGLFAANTAVFVPLGEKIGDLFGALPRLEAYAWNLGGSIAGTVVFGFFSLYAFSPLIGIMGAMALYLYFSKGKSLLISIPFFAVTIFLLYASIELESRAIWSPYHYITLRDESLQGAPFAGDPPASLSTMENPPIYRAQVNQNYYQLFGSIDIQRYTQNYNLYPVVKILRDQYFMPYGLFKSPPENVVVFGSGGGMDVEAALLAGARKVDAVDIDPALIKLSRKYSSGKVYFDPRVKIYNDDARVFIKRTSEKYDLVVFGFLDSQALASSMANIRLDGFVYTVEGIRTGYKLLNEGGILSLSFFLSQRKWLAHKLVNMVKEATGKDPLVYENMGKIIICAPYEDIPVAPRKIGSFLRITLLPPLKVPLATDDWPYLYLSRKLVPEDYVIVIATLIFLSLLSVLIFKPRGLSLNEGHFFFMGVGFLLLETKSIVDCSLYFGSTWLNTVLIIVGVLLMVLLSNYLAMRLRSFSKLLYLFLLVSLLLVIFTPRDSILSLGFWQRLSWAVLVMPLPIFFSGLIFSTTFRMSRFPAACFGANLFGATLGGFCEYLGMAIGYRKLSMLVIAAYAASFVCVLFWKNNNCGKERTGKS
ncbi:MAG: hypothetical protein ABH865_04860 [Candidatus Omnitrophota bacterium]